MCLADFVMLCSIFENGPIPYPKREFLTDDDNDDKIDTATSKVTATVISYFNHEYFLTVLCNNWQLHFAGIVGSIYQYNFHIVMVHCPAV